MIIIDGTARGAVRRKRVPLLGSRWLAPQKWPTLCDLDIIVIIRSERGTTARSTHQHLHGLAICRHPDSLRPRAFRDSCTAGATWCHS